MGDRCVGLGVGAMARDVLEDLEERVHEDDEEEGNEGRGQTSSVGDGADALKTRNHQKVTIRDLRLRVKLFEQELRQEVIEFIFGGFNEIRTKSIDLRS